MMPLYTLTYDLNNSTDSLANV